jgi:hypothetical protein
MSALPALPWGRAPSPPPKRARTDAGEDAAAPAAPSVWAGMPSKAPSCYGLAAGARLEARPSRGRERRPLPAAKASVPRAALCTRR